MRIKFLVILSIAAFLFLSGCRGENSNANANLANANVHMNTNMTSANITVTDTATKNTVESALKSKGFNDVMVDATTTGVTLRGTVAKGKMGEAVQTAQEAARKPVKNELVEK